MNLGEVINTHQFSLNSVEKNRFLLPLVKELNQFHNEHCSDFNKISDVVFNGNDNIETFDDLPFLPVSIFKNFDIKSINDTDVFKVLTSSGTTGQQVSKIYLDRETASLQTLALSKIVSHVLGKARLPMLIVDSKAVFSNKSSYSARGAGILGLTVFGRDHTYILDEKFEFNESILEEFLEKYDGQPFFIFGFTFMVWQYFYQSQLQKKYDLSKAILLHSGGWKKLIDISVDNDTFKKGLNEKFNLTSIYNFYGMVEQVGSIFLENSLGYLHCPNFADVIIRNPLDFSVQPVGEPGLIQVISALPKSYPGHSLLTEDIGVLMGEDDEPQGWKGKYFKILGRAKKAELRGCSDTFKTNLA